MFYAFVLTFDSDLKWISNGVGYNRFTSKAPIRSFMSAATVLGYSEWVPGLLDSNTCDMEAKNWEKSLFVFAQRVGKAVGAAGKRKATC